MSASSRLSPAANLLRSSRVFALPKPLAPALNNASSTPAAHSDTATSPYPTHAAIETHREARNIGDWGLKRPLPLKSTAGKDASYVRIRDGIDTREHIVDFEQAGDHVWTLRKFQALNIPVLFPQGKNVGSWAGGSLSSPFEDQYLSTEKPENLGKDAKRWRTQGPWIAGMTNSEFERWLYGNNEDAGAVGMKSDLRRFLQRTMLEDDDQLTKIVDAIMDVAGANGSELSSSQERSVQKFIEIDMDKKLDTDKKLDIDKELDPASLAQSLVTMAHGAPTQETKASVRSWLKERSSERKASTPLEKLLNKAFREHLRTLRARPAVFLPLLQSYFDLPDTPQNVNDSAWTFRHDSEQGGLEAASEDYKLSGMPTTHPSAGLGYLRLGDAIAANHELYGPQKEHEAVPARVLRTGRSHAVDRLAQAMFGVAGMVTDKHGIKNEDSIKEFLPVPGGQKFALRPTHVTINSEGRPVLEVRRSSKDKEVMAGLAKDMSIEEYKQRRQVKTYESMPPLGDNYTARSAKVNDALRKSRDGLRSLTNQTGPHRSRDSLNATEQSAVDGLLNNLDR